MNLKGIILVYLVYTLSLLLMTSSFSIPHLWRFKVNCYQMLTLDATKRTESRKKDKWTSGKYLETVFKKVFSLLSNVFSHLVWKNAAPYTKFFLWFMIYNVKYTLLTSLWSSWVCRLERSHDSNKPLPKRWNLMKPKKLEMQSRNRFL